jgi:hypothetical protein
VAGASGNFDGNGPYTRILVGAGNDTLTGHFPGGSLVGTHPPGHRTIEGVRPHWIGDLQPEDFRPDLSCTSQKLPSLASATAAPDFTSARSGRQSSPSRLERVLATLRGKP